jgi:hypothetical protein
LCKQNGEITQQVREFAVAEGLPVERAVEAGLAEKAAEFRRSEAR